MIYCFLNTVLKKNPTKLFYAIDLLRIAIDSTQKNMKFETENGLSRQLLMSPTFITMFSSGYFFIDYDIKNGNAHPETYFFTIKKTLLQN
jgi:hypothetical protein